MSQVPAGYVFQPSDEVLLCQYLLPKVTDKPLPFPGVVKDEFDLYQYTPDRIWDRVKGPSSLDNNDIYFFSILKKKKERISRTIDAGGTWSNEGTELVYASNNKQAIGTKRRFHYCNRDSPQHGCWVMHEYRLDVKGSKPSSYPSNSYVLCRLRKKDKNKNTSNSRKRKSPAEFQSQTQVRDFQIDSVDPSTLHPLLPSRNSKVLCNSEIRKRLEKDASGFGTFYNVF